MLEWAGEAEAVLFTVRWKDTKTRAEAALCPLTPGCGPRRTERIAPSYVVMRAQRRAVPSVFCHLAQLRAWCKGAK